MFTRSSRTLLAAAALPCMAAAQTITWGPVLPSIAPGDVSLNGAPVVARNLHAAGATQTPTVNGVTFTGSFAPTGWTNASTLALQASTTGNADYDLLLNSARATSAAATANPTGWGAIRIDNLGTLTVGHTYEIQCWFTDQRPGTGSAAIYDRVMTLSSAVGAATLTGGEVNNLGSLVQGPLSGPLDGDPDNFPALGTPDLLFGSHCAGTFTRVNGTDQIWLLVQGTHPIPANNLRSHLTAFQIRDLSVAHHLPYGIGCYAPTPLTLAGSPAPIITGGGTGPAALCTYTVTNVPEFDPINFPGFGAGTLVWSLTGAIYGGIDLGTSPADLGLPGCSLYLATQDAFVDISGPISGGPGGSLSFSIAMPQPLTTGLEFFVQALVLTPPGAPNTLIGTPYGARTSNGLRIHYDVQ